MDIRWYAHLYVGRRARKKRRSIIKGIRNRQLQVRVYVITPPSDGHNLLDIYPSFMLLNPGMAGRECMILGIAYGYQEALEVAGRIIHDLYQKTGGFELDSFLENYPGKR